VKSSQEDFFYGFLQTN